MTVGFIELAGDDAGGRLAELQTRLERQGFGCELLASRDRSGLYLLVVRAEALPDLELPAEARYWRFETLA